MTPLGAIAQAATYLAKIAEAEGKRVKVGHMSYPDTAAQEAIPAYADAAWAWSCVAIDLGWEV